MGSLIFWIYLMCSSAVLTEQGCQNVTLHPHNRCIDNFKPTSVMQMQATPHSFQHFEVYLIRPNQTGFTFDFLTSAGHLMALATKTTSTFILPPTVMCFCLSSNDWMSLTFEKNRERPVLKMLWKMFEKSITLIGMDLKEVELMRITNKGDENLNVKIVEEEDSVNGTNDVSKTPPDSANCSFCQEMKRLNENPIIFFTWQDIIIIIILISAVFGASVYAFYLCFTLQEARAKIASEKVKMQTTSEQKMKSRKRNCLPPTPPRKEAKNKNADQTSDINDFRPDEMPRNALPVVISGGEYYEEPIQSTGKNARDASASPRLQVGYQEEGNSCSEVNTYYEDDIYEEI